MDKIIGRGIGCKQAMSTKSMRFLPANKTCEFKKEISVLEVALRHEIEISHSCGGMGSCTTCRVIVIETPQPLPERGELEQDIADMRAFGPEERLACQLPPVDGLVVRVPVPVPVPST